MSEFPQREDYQPLNSQKMLEKASPYGCEPAWPLYVRRAKGAYVTDCDGYKYADFDLCGGSFVAGHHPVVLSHALKNAQSGSVPGGQLNRLTLKYFRAAETSLPGYRVYYYDNLAAALSAIRKATGRSGVKGAGEWVQRQLAENGVCQDDQSDLTIAEPVGMDSDLSDTDWGALGKGLKISLEYRTVWKFGTMLSPASAQADFVIAGPAVAGGTAGVTVFSREQLAGQWPSEAYCGAFLTMNSLMTRQKTAVFADGWQGLPLVKAVRGAVMTLRRPLAASGCLPDGVIVCGTAVFACMAHTEHDFKLLYRALMKAEGA